MALALKEVTMCGTCPQGGNNVWHLASRRYQVISLDIISAHAGILIAMLLICKLALINMCM